MRSVLIGFGVFFGLCFPVLAVERVCELVHAAGSDLYDKTIVKKAMGTPGYVMYAGELNEPNVASAQSMVRNPAVSLIVLDAAKTERMDINHLVNATSGSSAIVVGTFETAADPNLKPKLDAGLQGAILRSPSTKAEAEAFLDRLFFPPLGHRPLGPSRANGFLADVAGQRERANDVIVGAVSIGSFESVQNVDTIAQAKGLNLLVLDFSDVLAMAKRGPQENFSVRLGVALSRVERAARENNVPLAARVATRAEALSLEPRGYRVFIVGSDTGAIAAERAKFKNLEIQPAKEVPGEPLKTALKNDRLAILGFLMTPQPSYARELHVENHGLWIDAEHGPFSFAHVKEAIAALPEGSFPVVRAAHSTHPDIVSYLRAGAKGIVAPSVESAEQAEAFVKLVKQASPDAIAVVMIETMNGAVKAKEICAVRGIDVIHVGPYDLATSLEAEIGSQMHGEAIKAIEEAARANRIPLGGAARNREVAYQLYGRGYRFLTGVSDQEAIARHFQSVLGEALPTANAVVIRHDEMDPLQRFVQAAIIPNAELPWIEKADGTRVRAVSYGDRLTVQMVKKTGQTVTDHHHPQAQVTLILAGHSRVAIGETVYNLGPGDIIVIPPGVNHQFTDLSPDIEVIDLFFPRR